MGGWFLDDADFGCAFLGSTSLTDGASLSCNTDASAFIDIPTPSPTLLSPGAYGAGLGPIGPLK